MEIATLATIGGIAVLLVLSAFFSSSETALTAASRPRMHLLEAKGDKRAKLVNRLRSDQDNMIGTILLGNNLVNILASALATSVLISLFGETGVVYATIAMTLLVLIFGEILPKTYAFRYSDKLALTIAPTFLLLVRLLGPVMSAIQYLIRGVQRVFGVKIDSTQEWNATVEELRGAIEMHRGRGAMARHERAMLHSILDLADVDVEGVSLWEDGDGRCARVDPATRFRGRHALYAMDAGFVLQDAVGLRAWVVRGGPLAGSHGGDRHLVPVAHCAGALLDRLPRPSTVCTESLVHLKQVPGEQTGFLAARAGPHLHHAALSVHLVLWKHVVHHVTHKGVVEGTKLLVLLRRELSELICFRGRRGPGGHRGIRWRRPSRPLIRRHRHHLPQILHLAL